jgi:hypothetical protein
MTRHDGIETWSDAEGRRKEEDATQGKDKSIQLDGLVTNWPVALLLVHAVWTLLLADRRPVCLCGLSIDPRLAIDQLALRFPFRDGHFFSFPPLRGFRRIIVAFSSSIQCAICAPHSALLPPFLPLTGSRHLLLTDCTTLPDEWTTR